MTFLVECGCESQGLILGSTRYSLQCMLRWLVWRQDQAESCQRHAQKDDKLFREVMTESDARNPSNDP